MKNSLVGGYGASLIEDVADLNDENGFKGDDIVLIKRFITGGYNVELK